jgi:outer membrane protein assembly factor BamD
MFKLFVWLGLIISITLSSCATTHLDSPNAYPGESAQKIFAAGKNNVQKGNFHEAEKRFIALTVKDPGAQENELATIYLLYSYYRQEEFIKAINTASAFLKIHPNGKYSDYVYFMRGLAFYYSKQSILDRAFTVNLAARDTSDFKLAFADFAMVVRYFPHSNYAPAAQQYLIYLRELLAQHQLQTAQFYYQRKAYKAARQRASILVKHYQGSSYFAQALNLIADCDAQISLHKSNVT